MRVPDKWSGRRPNKYIGRVSGLPVRSAEDCLSSEGGHQGLPRDAQVCGQRVIAAEPAGSYRSAVRARPIAPKAPPAAATPEAAPTPRAQRGPRWSATQPTIGAPMGVPPRATATRNAITRPRMAGSVDNCIRLLVV